MRQTKARAIPRWTAVHTKVQAGKTITPLEQFIYDNEPNGVHSVKRFRVQLAKLLHYWDQFHV